MKKLPKIFIKLSLVISSVFLALLVAEVSLKITNYQKKEIPWRWTVGISEGEPHQPLFDLHLQRIYALNKNIKNDISNFDPLWSSDEYGFRYNPSHEHNINQNNKKVIVFVGDSFTYGINVEAHKTYPAMVEKKLHKINKDIVVHNAGVLGYGIDQEFLYIRDDIIPNHQPDIIVWSINDNDLFDSNQACLFIGRQSTLKQIPVWLNSLYLQGILLKITPSFLHDSALINLLLYLPMAITHRQRYTIGCTFPEHGQHEGDQAQFSRKIKYFLNELEKITLQKNIKLLITLVPLGEYFDGTILNNNFKFKEYQFLRNPQLFYSFEFIDSNQEIAALLRPNLFASRNNSCSVTLSNNTDNSSSEVLGISTENLAEHLFFDDDDHLNEEGNDLLAEIVSERLEFLYYDILSPR
jgi:lysophospholipase L1-like esterase